MGLKEIMEGVKEEIKREFNIERVVFGMVYDRCVWTERRKSELSLWDRIREDYWIEGLEEVKLEHLYRSLDVIEGKWEEIEKKLWEKRRDLLGLRLDLVFFDLTSIYFTGKEGGIKRRGYSRDSSPEASQIVVGILNASGRIPGKL